MKKAFVSLVVLILAIMPIVFAHAEDMAAMEDTSIGHQMSELLPFGHLSEGHWFAFVFSTILWLSFFYMLYSLYKMTRK